MFDFEKLDVYAKVEHVTLEIFRTVLTNNQIDPYIKDQKKSQY